MDADVIAVNIRWRLLRPGGVKLKSDSSLQFLLEVVRGPTMPQEEKFQSRALAVFPQLVGVAEQLGDSPDHRQNLVPAHKGIQRRAQVGLGGKSPTHSQPKANFRLATNHTFGCSQPNIVDLRVGAPHAASRDGDLELARQVIELGIPRQHAIRFERQR